MPTDPTLSYADLRAAVAGNAAALRLTLKMKPLGKVYPPTYEGGRYAEEHRRVPGHADAVRCVLLDSVQSQANRMECALQRAWERKLIKLPVIVVDLTEVNHPTVTTITSLQAPHRIADAILRDSLLDGTAFRESRVGRELDQLSTGNAAPLLKYCPTALLLGMWDSTYKRGGLGVKFARCLTSEVIGINAQIGSRAALRQDPLQIKKKAVEAIYRSEDDFWTLDKKKAATDKKSAPIKFGDGTPAAIVHGNIPTKLTEGGYTIDEAEQTTVLSLPAVRRLRFPGQPEDSETAAQTYIAALGLLSTALAVDAGFNFRSRCDLHAEGPVRWELLGAPGEETKHFALNTSQAIDLYTQALTGCVGSGHTVHTETLTLKPSEKFKKLITESVALWATDIEGSD